MKGFSLIEILVVLAVAAVAGFLLIQILVGNNNLLFHQSAKINQGLMLNDVISIIGTDIKGSSAVVAGYPALSPTVTTSEDSLVLQIPALDNSGNTLDQVFDYIAIKPDDIHSNVLLEQTYPDPSSSRKAASRVLLNNLSSINFTYTDLANSVVNPSLAARIGFTITLISKSGINQQQSSASARFNLRNG